MPMQKHHHYHIMSLRMAPTKYKETLFYELMGNRISFTALDATVSNLSVQVPPLLIQHTLLLWGLAPVALAPIGGRIQYAFPFLRASGLKDLLPRVVLRTSTRGLSSRRLMPSLL